MRTTPPRARRAAGLTLAALALTTLVACSGDDGGEQPAAPASGAAGAAPAVELDAAGALAEVGEPLRVGVLVSLRSAPGEGQDVLTAAEGARVAAYRLGLGGADVELEVVDDAGTSEGATRAVADLVDAGVSGIVAASTGEHLQAAVGAAAGAGVPLLLPYERELTALPDGVWATGPSGDAVDQALLAAMGERGLERPFVVSADGVDVDGVGSADREDYTGDNLGAVVARATRAVEDGTADSVVVAASATSQAQVVAALQGRGSTAPVVLSPEALSPGFATGLTEAGGTPAGEFLTVGVDASDATTLGTSQRAEATASYFSALRLAAGDPELQDLFGSVPFADVAEGADTASHDAVLALAAAAVEAGSVEPADVAAALTGLTVDTSDGLAGPALDFADSQALAPDAVVALEATTQDPQVRPVAATEEEAAPRLYWFATAAAGR